MTYRQKTEYLQKCQYCGRVGKIMYNFLISGKTYKACSMAHVNALTKTLTEEGENG